MKLDNLFKPLRANLKDLVDVKASSPEVGDVLNYANGVWKNSKIKPEGPLTVNYDPATRTFLFQVNDVQSGIAWQIVSSNTLAEPNRGYLVDVSSNPVILTLPANPVVGDQVGVSDYKKNSWSKAITVVRNGKKINGQASDLVVRTNGSNFILVYTDETQGWVSLRGLGGGGSMTNQEIIQSLDASKPLSLTPYPVNRDPLPGGTGGGDSGFEGALCGSQRYEIFAEPDRAMALSQVQYDTTMTPQPNTKLLMHFNRGFADSSRFDNPVMASDGSAPLLTEERVKFGPTSAYFPGSNSFRIPDPDGRFELGYMDFTIDLWISPDHVANQNYTILSYANGENGWFLRRLLSGWDSAWLFYIKSGEFTLSLSGDVSYRPPGEFELVTITRRRSSWEIYHNGVPIGHTQESGEVPPVGASHLEVGGPPMESYSYFQGAIAELRINVGSSLWKAPFITSGLPWIKRSSDKVLINFDLPPTASTEDAAGMGPDLVQAGPYPMEVDFNTKKFTSSMSFSNGSYLYGEKVLPPLLFGTGAFTVEFWIYNLNTSTSSTRHLLNYSGGVDEWNPSGTSFGAGIVWRIYWGTDNRLYFDATNGSGGSITVSSNTGVNLSNGWNHVAVSSPSGTGTIRMYLNGSQIGTGSRSGTITTQNPKVLVVGKSPSFSGGNLLGWMEEIRISNVNRYPNGDPFVPSTTPFTVDGNTLLLYHLNRIKDVPQDQVGGTVVRSGNATFVPRNMRFGNGSFFFPGGPDDWVKILPAPVDFLSTFGWEGSCVDFWMNTTQSPSQEAPILSVGNGTQNQFGTIFEILLTPGGTIKAVLVLPTWGSGPLPEPLEITLASEVVVNDGRMHHVALFRHRSVRGGELQPLLLSVDGIHSDGYHLTSVQPDHWDPPEDYYIMLGASHDPSQPDRYRGHLDELRITSREPNWRLGFSPPDWPLETPPVWKEHSCYPSLDLFNTTTLKHWWKLDGYTWGWARLDSMGDHSLEPAWEGRDSPDQTQGIIDGGCRFYGPEVLIRLGTGEDNLKTTGVDYTLSMAAYRLGDSPGGGYSYLFAKDDGTNETFWGIVWDDHPPWGRIKIDRFGDFTLPIPVWTSGWLHIVVTNRSGYGKLYLNGERVLGFTNPDLDSPSNHLCVGGILTGSNPTNYGFYGLIDEIMYWEVALSDDDIWRLYRVYA